MKRLIRVLLIIVVLTSALTGGAVYYFLAMQPNSTKMVLSQQTMSAGETGAVVSGPVKQLFTRQQIDGRLQTDPLNFDSMFGYVSTTEAEMKDVQPGHYTIIATGDIIPARSVNAKMVRLNDFNYPFEKTVNLLHSGDGVFINFESPLVAGCKATLEGMVFCGDPKDVQGLVYAGVSVASLANNHAGNYGKNGIDSTITLLKQNNIQVTGNGQPAILTIKGKKFGFLGYNDVGASPDGIVAADPLQIQKDVTALKKLVDFVIVTLHWGVEYTSLPTDRQVDLAHTAVDAGADLIIGNHPHWVQGVERYKGKLIIYAHGNYVFDQMWSPETREGVVGKYTFDNNGLIDVKFVPVIIEDYAQPRYANEVEAKMILGGMRQASEEVEVGKRTR